MSEQFDQQLENDFRQMRQVPPRNTKTALEGRAIFLAEAERINKSVSNHNILRHKGWIYNKTWVSRVFRKETSRMLTSLVSAILAILVVLGGSGVTVAAAQSSDSDDFLYPVKLMSEDIRLQLTNDPEKDLDLQLEFLNRRTLELFKLTEEDQLPSTGLMTRLQNQINTALQLALSLEQQESLEAMQKIRVEMQAQEMLMQQLQTGSGELVQSQVQSMLQERLQLVNSALEDPLQNQEQLQQQLQQQIQAQEALGEQIQQQTQEQIQQQTGSPEEPNGYGEQGAGYGEANGDPLMNGEGMMGTAEPQKNGNGKNQP